jgi:uncharacterized protein YbjT (DUF2867 family)
MKVLVVGGSGRIGARLVERLRAAGHEAVPASRRTGVDTVTGAGLAEVLDGVQVVVDVSNPPAPEDALDFFRASSRTLLAAERAAGVRHHMVVSIVGVDRLPDTPYPYFRAKLAQEELVQAGGVPYTLLRATQFFEFLGTIVAAGTDGDEVRLPDARLQPVAADDVADTLAELAVGEPADGIVELAGPQALPMVELARRYLADRGENRKITADPHARYFGAELPDTALLPGSGARIGRVRLAEWLSTREEVER